jgi:hypothetical protein
VEVAERRADENSGQAGGNALALESVEDFRAVVEAGEKHVGRKAPITNLPILNREVVEAVFQREMAGRLKARPAKIRAVRSTEVDWE